MMDSIRHSDFAAVTYRDFRRLRSDWGAELVVRFARSAKSHLRQLPDIGQVGFHGCSPTQTIFEHLKVRETAISAAGMAPT